MLSKFEVLPTQFLQDCTAPGYQKEEKKLEKFPNFVLMEKLHFFSIFSCQNEINKYIKIRIYGTFSCRKSPKASISHCRIEAKLKIEVAAPNANEF